MRELPPPSSTATSQRATTQPPASRQPSAAASRVMTPPVRYLLRMLLFLAVVGGLLAAYNFYWGRMELWGLLVWQARTIETFFLANAALNGLIIGILIIGILYCLRQVLVLWPEVRWIEHYNKTRTLTGHTRLFAPMQSMLRARNRPDLRLNDTTIRALLDGIGIRLDERRDISRYTIALLVFLGLIGTFWGLLETVESIVVVIDSLKPGGFAEVFRKFQEGLVGTLKGAGTAFSASLFGLASSLILGFVDLQAGQAQNRFYTDLEDWLSGKTRISVLPTDASGDSFDSVSAYLQALLEHTATTMDDLSQTMVQGEADRKKASQSVTALAERLGLLVEQLHTQQALLARLADTQIELKPILGRLSEEQSFGRQELVTALRTEFRNLAARIAEVQLQVRPYLDQMTKDNVLGRQEMIREMRSETEILARAITSLANMQERQEIEMRAIGRQKG
jgi:hypothetical protein